MSSELAPWERAMIHLSIGIGWVMGIIGLVIGSNLLAGVFCVMPTLLAIVYVTVTPLFQIRR